LKPRNSSKKLELKGKERRRREEENPKRLKKTSCRSHMLLCFVTCPPARHEIHFRWNMGVKMSFASHHDDM
jgi:hypothetical protein